MGMDLPRGLPDGWRRIIVTTMPTENGKMVQREEHDLCPTCREDFDKWILFQN